MPKINATLRIRDIEEETFYSLLDLIKQDAKRVAHETFTSTESAREFDLEPAHVPVPAITGGGTIRALIYCSTPPPNDDPKPWKDYSGYRYAHERDARGVRMTYSPRVEYHKLRAHTGNGFLIAFRNNPERLSQPIKTAIKQHNAINKVIKGGPAEHARRVLKRYVNWLKTLDTDQPRP